MQSTQKQNNVKLNTTQPKVLPSKPDLKTKAIEKAFNFLKQPNIEGIKLKSYQCPAGVWTIGIGTTVINGKPVTSNLTITLKEAEEYCKKDIEKCLNSIWSDVWSYNANQIAAIISFVYNFGYGDWQSSTLRKIIVANPNNFDAIANQFRRWIYVKDPNTKQKKESDGLINRRKLEIQLYCSSNI